MPEAAGYILQLKSERIEVLASVVSDDDTYFEHRGVFSEPVRDFEHSRSVPLVCFVIDEDNHLRYVAMARRGQWSATDLRKLTLNSIAQVNDGTVLQRAVQSVAKRHRFNIDQKLISGGLLTAKQLIALVDEIVKIDTELAKMLARFGSVRAQRLRSLSGSARAQLAAEKEAIATALLLADMDRGRLQNWQPPENEAPRSYLDGLPQERQREDAMIINDLVKFPGFDFVRAAASASTVLQDESGTSLTITVANRLPLEKLTGADLIYFNETYQSFVMVQYKAMEQEQGEEAIFRLPNNQLDVEIERMDAVVLELSAAGTLAVADGFRFTWNPFFLKLCPRLTFHPDSTSLSSGMYLPLEKWKLLAASQQIVGPKGGRGITFKNVRRHLDNTSFAMLVAGGWVGTTPGQSEPIASAIRETISSGRAAVIAIRKGPVPSRNWKDKQRRPADGIVTAGISDDVQLPSDWNEDESMIDSALIWEPRDDGT